MDIIKCRLCGIIYVADPIMAIEIYNAGVQ